MKIYRMMAIIERDMRKFFRNPMLMIATMVFPLTQLIVLGYAYFAAVTSLSTVLQEHLDDRVRGRVMALWVMAFGGMVPLGTLVAGTVATHTSITLVMLLGAGVAALLAYYADLAAVGAPT